MEKIKDLKVYFKTQDKIGQAVPGAKFQFSTYMLPPQHKEICRPLRKAFPWLLEAV